jgi:hypothetical protein
MREFLGHLWDMTERVPLVIYEPAAIPLAGDDENDSFDEQLTLCNGADIVLVQSEEERQVLAPYFAGRIELRSEQTTREILSEIYAISRPQEQQA